MVRGILALLMMSASGAIADDCTVASSFFDLRPAMPPSTSSLDVAPPLPWWVALPCLQTTGEACRFEVRLTLEKIENDGRSACEFRRGVPVFAAIEVINRSTDRYVAVFGDGQFWELYVYDPVTLAPVSRMSYHEGYTDDIFHIDLQPGESLTEWRLWEPWLADESPIPAGIYRLYGRLEPHTATDPRFTRQDTSLSESMTIVIYE